MITSTLREMIAEHLRAARTGNTARQHQTHPPTRDDLAAADRLIAALPGAGLTIGGDYPRDDATRTLVSCALAVATTLERETFPVQGIPNRALVAAAHAWHKAHTAPTNRRG
jgi:hypothetical protein